MISFGTFLVIYLVFTLVFVFILLFGENLVFQHTPVAWAHWLVTQGFWQGLEWLVARTCGRRCVERLDRLTECCFDRPNPVLQISYIFIISGMLWLYWTHFFSLLPNPGAAEYHRYTGIACVLLCLAIFVAACRSDPGTVTSSNTASHAALYPRQGLEVLWPQKDCTTCLFTRPARSKHCSLCGRCVSRFDHHCAWINNCVGLGNLRLFLLFLLANVALCVYGSVLAVCILVGELHRYGVFQHKSMNWQTGEAEILMNPPIKLFQWLLLYSPVSVALVFFLIMAGLLMAAFFGYQMRLISQGKTQYEAFRWLDLHKFLIHEEEERQRQQAPPGSRSLLGRLAAMVAWRRPKVELPPNIFNRGFKRNLSEVLFWEWHLRRAGEAAGAAALAAEDPAGLGEEAAAEAAAAAAEAAAASAKAAVVPAAKAQSQKQQQQQQQQAGGARKRAKQ